MGLPRPPLAHPVSLSLPPHLPPALTDQIHALLFERLLVPQLLVASRPFFAAAGAGVTSAVVLDIGARGEGSEVSVVYDSQVVETATLKLDVDEGDLDDWLALVLLEEDPSLPELLKPTEEGAPLSSAELYDALSQLVQAIKAIEGAIGFESSVVKQTTSRVKMITDDDDGFDVAKALVEGGVDRIVKKGKPTAADEDKSTSIEVSHPLNPSAPPIKVGPGRHRWLEPLFLPALLAELAPSASPAAGQLGLGHFSGRAVVHTGVHEVIGAVVCQVEDIEQRRGVWESVVIISTGKVASNKREQTRPGSGCPSFSSCRADCAPVLDSQNWGPHCFRCSRPSWPTLTLAQSPSPGRSSTQRCPTTSPSSRTRAASWAATSATASLQRSSSRTCSPSCLS